MNKIQFYPSDELCKAIKENADAMDISINALVCDFLTEAFCDVPERKCKSESELTKDVFSEVEEFISDKDIDYEFDLMSASPTYADIKNVFNNRTKEIRSKVGNNFAKKVGNDERFKNVEVAKNRNGNTKRNRNNAIMYKVVKL